MTKSNALAFCIAKERRKCVSRIPKYSGMFGYTSKAQMPHDSCPRMCMYTYTHVHIHVYTDTCVYRYMYVHIQTHYIFSYV